MPAAAPPQLTVVAGSNTTPRSVLTQRFKAALTQSVGGIIEAGKVLLDGKAQLKHGEFLDWLVNELPLGGNSGVRSAQMLMVVAAHPVLANANHWFAFPPSWRTLYELARLRPQSRLLKLIDDGTIHPGISREQAMTLNNGKPQPLPEFIVAAALQRQFAKLSDAEALNELRSDPGALTPDTLKQFAQRLATLANLWEQ
jgi:hypothetical protein